MSGRDRSRARRLDGSCSCESEDDGERQTGPPEQSRHEEGVLFIGWEVRGRPSKLPSNLTSRRQTFARTAVLDLSLRYVTNTPSHTVNLLRHTPAGHPSALPGFLLGPIYGISTPLAARSLIPSRRKVWHDRVFNSSEHAAVTF